MSNVVLILALLVSFVHISYQDFFGFFRSKKADIQIEKILLTSYSATAYLKYENQDLIKKVQIEVNGHSVILDGPNLPSHYDIDNLEPCTDYNLYITMYPSEDVRNKNFKTNSVIIPPVANIKYNHLNGLLTWTQPSYATNCIKQYRISYDGIVEFSKFKRIMINNLPGCSSTEIIIETIDLNGSIGSRGAADIEIGFKEPDELKVDLVESRINRSINVKWSKPKSNPNCIDYFMIQYDGRQYTTNSTSFEINNAESCQTYKIEICSIMKYKQNQKCSSHELETKYANPEIVIGSTKMTPYSANISFDLTNVNCIKSIEVKLDNGVYELFNNGFLYYFVNQLTECSDHNLSIRTFNKNDKYGKSVEKNFKTSAVPISYVKNIKFFEQTNLLTWDRPSHGAQCIEYYLIDYLEIHTRAVVESIELFDLPGCLDFQIKITAVGSNDSKGLTTEEMLRSGFKKPNPVRIVYADSKTSDSITINWNFSTINLHCFEAFAIIYNNSIGLTNLTTYTISKLEPCTVYNIKVCLVMTNNQTGQCTDVQPIRTESDIPEIIIGSISSHPYSAHIPLQYKNINCIARIEIGLHDGTPQSYKKHLPSYHNFDLLKPCSEYKLIFKTYSTAKYDVTTITKSFITEPVSIGPVTNIEFNQSTDILTWDPPSIGSDCIIHYTIHYDGVRRETTNESIELSELPGCISIQLEITPMGYNVSKGLNSINYFETGFKKPSVVKNLYAMSYSPNSINVSWSMPTVNPNCVKNFIIMHNDFTIARTNSTGYTIDNLEPCTVNSIQVCVAMKNNEVDLCSSYSENVMTKSAMPEIVVGSIIADSMSGTVSIIYKNINCIEKMELGFVGSEPVLFEKSNLPQEYELTMLKPCTSYDLRLVAFSSYNNLIVRANETFTTKSVLIGSVENVEFNNETDKLIWNRPSHGSECIKYYVIDGQIDKHIAPLEYLGLSHLPGCSNFTVQIVPVDEHGVNGTGFIKTFQTGMKDPDSVGSLSAFSESPSSITLTYDAPTKNQKCVQNYVIEYSGKIEITNLTRYVVRNLEPCTEYNLRVCILVINNRRSSQCTPVQTVTTKPEHPETTIGTIISGSFFVNVSLEYKNPKCLKHIDIGLINGVVKSFNQSNLPGYYYIDQLMPCTNYVIFINTHSNEFSKIFRFEEKFTTKFVLIDPVENIQFDQETSLLTWLRPNLGANCVDRYKIYDGEKLNQTYSEYYNLQYLPGCSRYTIQITSIGRDGVEGIESSIDIETGVKLPGRVENLYADSYSFDSITVTWTFPRMNRDCVKNFAIFFNEATEYSNITTYEIKHLEPCTRYNIKVCTIMINNGTGLCTNFIQKVTTLPARPEIIIESINYDSASANASLAYKNSNCIWYFEVGLNNDVLDKYEKPNLKQHYHIGHLKPCSEYKLFIKVYPMVSSISLFSTNASFETKSVPISKVANVDFNYETGLLIWNRPDLGAECVRWYTLDWSGDRNVSLSESFGLSHLPGCSKYEIGITPEGDNQLKGERSVHNIQTKFKSPDGISNLIAVSNTPTSISMTWKGPIKNPNCVKNYSIQYDYNIEYTNLTEYTVYNLEPCVNYSIQICIETTNNRVCSDELFLRTMMGIPSKVQELHYSHSVIKWQPSSYGFKCLQNYVLTIYDLLGSQIVSQEITSSQVEINRELLKSCQNYKVSVIALNINNEKGDAADLKFKTEPMKPRPPTAPILISKTAISLELESNYENDRDLCPLQSVIFTCRATDTDEIVRERNGSLSQHQNKFTVTMNDLSDLTNYTCTVRITNEIYSSSESFESVFETDEHLSDPPHWQINAIGPKTITIGWQAPIYKIRLKRYHVKIIKVDRNYIVPQECPNLPYTQRFRINPNVLNHEFINLEPFTNYSIQIAIENTAGIGLYGNPIEIVTKPDTPHQVNRFRIDRIYSDQTVDLKWDWPCEINGEINSIKGVFYESQPPIASVTSFEWTLKSPINLQSMNSYKETRIKPEHTYNITIGIEIKDFTGPMNETTVSFTSPAGIPAAYSSSNWGSIPEKTYPRNNVKLKVNKNLFSSAKGKIRKFTFLISELNCQDAPRPSYMFFINKFDETNSRLPSWFDFVDNDCMGQYQIQDLSIHDNFVEHGLEFIIGNQICDEINRYIGYCNGPLKAGTDYAVIGRVFTSVGYADTNPIYFTTESNFSIMLLVIFMFIIILGLLIAFAIKRFKENKSEEPTSANVINNVQVNVSSTQTPNHDFKIDLDTILDEYDSINTMNLSDLTTNEAKHYKNKNRYANILPYDQNRVHLLPNAYSSTGYINASYVDGYSRADEYIATQGPVLDTCYDFWNMIIETNCHKIVMLTRLVESDVLKCAQYYPDPNDMLQFNDITVINVRELDLSSCTRRDLTITKGTAEHQIVQYHFQNWPDHGCPENELDLIRLIQFVRSDSNRVALSAPIVVHCSAGVGRTGTLIALDILMQQISNDINLDICETVKNLRYQRVKMVQTLSQYQFLYKCAAYYLRQKWPDRKY